MVPGHLNFHILSDTLKIVDKPLTFTSNILQAAHLKSQDNTFITTNTPYYKILRNSIHEIKRQFIKKHRSPSLVHQPPTPLPQSSLVPFLLSCPRSSGQPTTAIHSPCQPSPGRYPIPNRKVQPINHLIDKKQQGEKMSKTNPACLSLPSLTHSRAVIKSSGAST